MGNGKMKRVQMSNEEVQTLCENEMGKSFDKAPSRNKQDDESQKSPGISYANWQENAGGALPVDGKRKADQQKSRPNKA